MPPAAPQQQGQNDSGLGHIWIIVGVFILALIIWYLAQEYIVLAIFKIKLAEIFLIQLFTSKLTPLKIWIYLSSQAPGNVTFGQLQIVSTTVGNYLKFPIALILGGLAAILYFSSVTIRFKATYNMKRLLEAEKENWPQITPVAKTNIVKEPLDEGPWAMSMPPMVFAKKYNLIIEEEAPLTEDSLSRERKVLASLNRQAATRIFALQLGEIWQGPEKLPIYAQALFAIFAARANHDTESSTNMLRQISASSSRETLNFEGTKALLKKYRDTKVVKMVEQRHAYVLTVMASMLVIARTDGVLASSEFLWLKPINRRLWYMLNTVGRQTAVPEIAGAYAHWITEKDLDRRLTVPMVEQATNALEIALQEIVYKPDAPKQTDAENNQGEANSGSTVKATTKQSTLVT